MLRQQRQGIHSQSLANLHFLLIFLDNFQPELAMQVFPGIFRCSRFNFNSDYPVYAPTAKPRDCIVDSCLSLHNVTCGGPVPHATSI